MSRKLIGIILVILAFVLLGAVIVSIGSVLPQSGPWIGKITQYREPFVGHGLLMTLGGIAAAISFLAGIVLIVMDKR